MRTDPRFVAVVPLLAVSLFLWAPPARAAETSSSCVTCHAGLDGELAAPAAAWKSDLHAAAGLGCEACHGGDPSPALAENAEAAMSPAKGFRPKPDRLRTPEFCARCHSDAAFMKQFNPQARVDQLTEYRTSVHGKLNAGGDPTPAVCTDCHGVHGMRHVASPDSPVYAANVPKTCARCHSDSALLSRYGIPVDQFEKYSRSVHGAALIERGDLAAPACNDCHGNHGAAPPGVRSVANVCGQCHGREAILFDASFKKDLFESTGVGECTVCHDHHRIDHPTPELFHGTSAPQVSAGTVVTAGPFAADLGDLAAAGKATASWRVVIRPHMESGDARLAHRVEVSAAGIGPLSIDATVGPGAVLLPPRSVADTGSGFTAVLTIEPLSGVPVDAGDALLLNLAIDAGKNAAREVKVKDVPGEGLNPLDGSACLTCHTQGDACDVATIKMYDALTSLDHSLRDASLLLRKAELAGMEVSGPQFELKSKGTTAAVESRALIHAFDPERLIARTEEGKKVAAATLDAAKAALAEVQNRRKGLAVSLVLVVLVLAMLYMKIRQVDRTRRLGAPESRGPQGA